MNDFLESIESLDINGFQKDIDDLVKEDVIDETNLDSWTVDDFLEALPYTIEYYNIIFGLQLYYCYDNVEEPCWIACYKNFNGDNKNEFNGDTPHEALKKLYKKINE